MDITFYILSSFLLSAKNIVFFNIVFDIAQDSLLVLSKISLKIYSKYNGCIVKNLALPNCFNVDELKKNIDNEKLKQFILYLDKLRNYTSEENLITVYQNLNTVKLKKINLYFF